MGLQQNICFKQHFTSAGESLNAPPPGRSAEILPQFSHDLFSHHLQQLRHLCAVGPFAMLWPVPLNQYFCYQWGPFAPWYGLFTPYSPHCSRGVRGWSATALYTFHNTTKHHVNWQQTVISVECTRCYKNNAKNDSLPTERRRISRSL